MVLLLGIITIIIAFVGKYYAKFNLPINSIWYFMGMGFGLIFGGITVLIKFYILIKNKEKLRKERIKNSDERNMEISIKVSRITIAAIFGMLYIAIIISGFLNPELMKPLTYIILLAVFTYSLSYRFFERKI